MKIAHHLATSFVFVVVWSIGVSAPSAPPQGSGPLRIRPQNRRYFTDNTGKAIYLTGSHTWNNFKDMGPADPPATFDFDAYLRFLEQHGQNFIRLWTWELTKYAYDGRLTYAQPFPWPRTGPGDTRDGKPKFDLSKLDPAYFERLRGRVEAAGRRGIYVSVMLFEGHGLHASDAPWCWDGHPFCDGNNINGIDGDPNGDGRGIETQSLQVPAVTAIQETYVRKVLDTLGDCDNVLYEIVNESGAYSTAWQYHFIRFIHEYEKRLPKQHPVGMTFQYARDAKQKGTNAALMAGPADWISPNPDGGYRDNPPAADGTKVILSDTDHLWGIGGNPQWVWKSFCRGLNPIFMDPYTRVDVTEAKGKNRTAWTDHLASPPRLDPKWEPVRRAMGQTRSFAQRMDLAAAKPEDRLASSGYCLAHAAAKDAEYLVYLPGGGELTVDLSRSPGKLAVEWFDPTQDKSAPSGDVQGGLSRAFKAPFQGDAVLYLTGRDRLAGNHKDELKVAKVRRISHSGYAAGQCTFGIRDPWNCDRSRLMYNEGANFTGKQPYYYWSPVVWGFVSELKHWKTAEEYERARKHVNEDRHFGFSANLWWSIFPGEENIMYAAHLASKKVVRFNVDSEQMTDVCSYDPGDGRDLSHVRVMGWTTNSKLIVTLGDNNGDVIPEQGGWEIDAKTKKRTYVPVARDDYSRWPAIASHGHGTFSPDRSMYFRCGGNELRALPSKKLIRKFATWGQRPPFSLEHLSWRASNDWFTCESGGPEWNRIATNTGKWPRQPLLDKITIYQIWTDGEIRPLLTTVTACAWSGKDGPQHWNYEGEPIPDHSRDGRQLIFPSYDGVYSRDDHEAFGSMPCGNCGLFLADLVPAAGNDDKVVPSKPAMVNGIFDPSSRSIRLAWARCTDNVSVDRYHVYRDGEKIATTGFIHYTDTIKGPVSASYRYSIGAVDVAGNEAKSSEISVHAAR